MLVNLVTKSLVFMIIVRVCFALNKIFTIPLDFRDRIIKTSLAFNHLVVATTSQCYIYRLVALEWVWSLI